MQRFRALQPFALMWARAATPMLQCSVEHLQLLTHMSLPAYACPPQQLQLRINTSAVSSSCWRCSKQLDGASFFFCSQCKAILPPAPAHRDLYRVMGLAEPTFDVDLRKLEARYKQLQKDLHPDRFGNQEAKAQEFSAEQSSLVNHAYVKLKSPLQRALYLLETMGQAVPEDGGTISDPELLMEVMEQREMVEETNDPATLQTMLAENKLLEQATTEKLSDAFRVHDLTAAEKIITDLRYVTRTGEAISKKLP